MVTRTGTHALQALAYLGTLGDGRFAGAADIAGRIGAPRNYLGKLLRQLSTAGLLEGRKGKTGGFRLSRRPEEITLFSVLEPIERVSRVGRCILGSGACTGRQVCAIHGQWSRIRDAYLAFLHESHLGALTVMHNGHPAKEASYE